MRHHSKPKASTAPLTISGLARAVAERTGRCASESTLRNLERRCIITAIRDSANRRLFRNPQDVNAVIAYYEQRDAALQTAGR